MLKKWPLNFKKVDKLVVVEKNLAGPVDYYSLVKAEL